MSEEDDSIKYYNDVVLYRTIEQIDRIINLEGQKRDSAKLLLEHLSDYFNEESEHNKMYFINSMMDYMNFQYQNSFEETYILNESANKIKKQIEDEYGRKLP